MNTIKHLGAMFAAAALAAVAYADDPPTIDLTFAPGDTLAYSHDGCEPVALETSTSPVTLELGRNGHYTFYSNGVFTATRDVSDLGTKVTDPNWATVHVTFMLDTKVERTFDLSGGVVTTNLTYSGTGWDEPGAGTSATITYAVGEGQPTTLATGLTGAGEKPWTPTANGTYALKHTSGTATETATITVANLPTVTITVGDLAAKHLTAKVVWNGTETPVTGQSFVLPKDVTGAKLVLTAKDGFVLQSDQPSEIGLDDCLARDEPVSIADDIHEAVEFGVQLLGVTNRYPWNGKIDVVASVAGLDTTKYYSLVTTLTLDGTTKRVSRELGAGKDATYTNTIDCAALFDEEFVGEVSVKLSLEQYATERAVEVVSVVKPVDLTKGEYLIIDLEGGTSVETTLGDYLKTYPNAWTLEDGWAEDYKTKYLVMRKVKAGEDYPCEPGASSYPISGTMKPAKDYWIGVHQVTVAQYERVMTEGGSKSADAKPKNSISWNEIRTGDGTKTILPTADVEENSFMDKLCALTGLDDFDLPTEAQWEIAARAGSAEEYGSYVDGYGVVKTATKDDLTPIAWYKGNVTSPQNVGQLRPNLWGLYDTAGNVWEWCRDCGNGSDPADVESPRVPPGGDSSDRRVNRGGCYINVADGCRPSFRYLDSADDADDFFGFRLSRICNPDAQNK